MSILLLSALAFAEDPAPVEPSVVVQADGTVVCRMTLPASAPSIEAALADPIQAARLSPEVLSVEATAQGSCHNIVTTSRGLFSALKLETKRCPTADGWHEVLVASDDFSAFDGSWTVTPVDAATTEVVYELQTQPNLPVPDAVLRQGMQKSLKTMLRNLRDRVVRFR